MKLRYLSLLGIIFLIPVCVWAWGVLGISGGVPPSAACTVWLSQLSYNTYYSFSDSHFGQLIDNASARTVCKVKARLFSDAGTEQVHIELWSDNLKAVTQYLPDSPQVTITSTSDPGELYEFTWTGTKPNVTANDFYVHIVRDSGTIYWVGHSDGTTYGTLVHDAERYGVDLNADMVFEIYTE